MAKLTASERYWEKRRELEDQARLKMENQTIKDITSVFPDALKKIQEQLLSQAELHDMTYNELMENFSNRDQKAYRKFVDKNYKQLMKSDDRYQEFIDEYFPSYDYAKVNRLLQIRTDIFNTLASEMIKKDPTQKFNDGLEDIIKRTYNSNSNVLMNLLGPGDVHSLSKSELSAMLNHPWSGKTFSNRLWGNVAKLEQNLSKSIVDSIQSGNGVLNALKTMREDPEIADMFKQEEGKFKKAIERLVRTEYAHFATEGVKKSLDDIGVKDKASFSAQDERVCSVCGPRHDKIIEDDWFPPYHGWCRCSVIPKMPKLGTDIDREYEAMFGDLLDEFAKDQFGIKLNHPKAKKVKSVSNSASLSETIRNDKFLKSQQEQLDSIYSEINTVSQNLKVIRSDYIRNKSDEISEQYNKLVKQHRDLVMQKSSFEREYVQSNAKRILEHLSQQRSFGYEGLDMKGHITNGRAQMSKLLLEAYEYYPTDWIKESIEYGTITTKKVNRGYYAHGKNAELAISGGSGLRSPLRTAIHELGHRQEAINADILKAEKEFYERRTAGERLVKLRDVTNGNYRASEVTKVDNFISPYMGKDYGGDAYELLTMGVDTLFTEPMKLAEDKDMFDWVIEMLLTK